MDDRIVEFIAGLRAAGVRVSVAESADALRAIAAAGIADKDFFRLALRATLVKESQDMPTFEELFPQYFGPG
ncbi:MAG TPA: CoxE, partial [Roseiflexaceae bacterium]